MAPPSLYIQPPGTGTRIDDRVNVSDLAAYEPIATRVSIILLHMASSPEALGASLVVLLSNFYASPKAQTAFRTQHGHKGPVPTVDMIHEYLSMSPPAIVIADIDSAPPGDDFTWGLVTKGTTDATTRNELFISWDLATALVSIYDPSSSPSMHKTQKQLAFLHLLFSVTFMHEVQHCLTKYFFLPTFITPSSATPGTSDCHRNGESGHCFEKFYFGFSLVAEWKSKEDATQSKRSHRMWAIDRLLARQGEEDYVLPITTVNNILSLFHTNLFRQPVFSTQDVALSVPGVIRCTRACGKGREQKKPAEKPARLIGLGIEYEGCIIRT